MTGRAVPLTPCDDWIQWLWQTDARVSDRPDRVGNQAPTARPHRRARRSAAGGAFVAVKIVVCVKQVPDSWAEKKLNPADNTLDREAADAVVNELDEYAIEEALQIQERLGGADACTVTVLTVGPEKAIESVRKGLQMGADDGVHVVDDALHGSDALATSAVLAAAIDRLAPDLVLMGSESTDARMSVVPAMLAERTGRPQLTFAGKVELDGQHRSHPARDRLRVRRRRGASSRRWSASSRRSTNRATPRSRGSWPPRRSRSRPSRSPTSASKPAGVGLLGFLELGAGLRGSTAARSRHRRHRRGRRRRQGRRVPGAQKFI